MLHVVSARSVSRYVSIQHKHNLNSAAPDNRPPNHRSSLTWDRAPNSDRNGAIPTQSAHPNPMHLGPSKSSFQSYQSIAAATSNSEHQRAPSPDYVEYYAHRGSIVSERINSHSNTLNRLRYSQAPGGPTAQMRMKSLEDYYREDSSEGEDDFYESEKPRPGVETMIPQDGEQVSVRSGSRYQIFVY